jgi:hypothetical protein
MTLQKEEGEEHGCGMQAYGDIKHSLHKNIKQALFVGKKFKKPPALE